MQNHVLSARAAHLFAAFVATATLTQSAFGQTADSPRNFNQWFCQVFGLPVVCRVLDGLRVLSPDDDCDWRRRGVEIRRYRLGGTAEDVIWKCGECASPLPVSDTELAVVAAEGIVRVSVTGHPAPQPVVSSPGILRLLWRLPNDSGRIAIAVERPEGGPGIAVANLNSGELEPWPPHLPYSPELPSRCEAQKIIAVETRACMAVSELDRAKEGWILVVDRFESAFCVNHDDSSGLRFSENSDRKRLLGFSAEDTASWNRFDPSWSADGSSVYYVASPR